MLDRSWLTGERPIWVSEGMQREEEEEEKDRVTYRLIFDLACQSLTVQISFTF